MENEEMDVEIKAFDEFQDDLSEFLDKWRSNENLPSIFLQTGLLYEAKIEGCWNDTQLLRIIIIMKKIEFLKITMPKMFGEEL